MPTPAPSSLCRATARGLLFLAACASGGGPRAAAPDDWAVVGRQGIVSLVLVPEAQATELAAYRQQIDRLCQAGQTCFLNFYTNSKAVAVTVPLPDEISSEATATFRRSAKIGAEAFMWSCRLKASTQECF